MVTNCDVLPRQGFSQMARNMRCQLYFPYPAEQVILLRTGVLVHINAYMQALGLHDSHTSQADHMPSGSKPPVQSPHTTQQHEFKHSNGFAHGHQAVDKDSAHLDAEVSTSEGPPAAGSAVSQDAAANTEAADTEAADTEAADTAAAAETEAAAAAAAAAVDWHGPVPAEHKDELRRVWQHLKETVEALPHVVCYTIASVAYRRSVQPAQHLPCNCHSFSGTLHQVTALLLSAKLTVPNLTTTSMHLANIGFVPGSFWAGSLPRMQTDPHSGQLCNIRASTAITHAIC